MKNKLKGCRPSQEVATDYSNTCAVYGSAHHRIEEITEDLQKIKTRLKELRLELEESRKQESEQNTGVNTESEATPASLNMELVQ